MSTLHTKTCIHSPDAPQLAKCAPLRLLGEFRSHPYFLAQGFVFLLKCALLLLTFRSSTSQSPPTPLKTLEKLFLHLSFSRSLGHTTNSADHPSLPDGLSTAQTLRPTGPFRLCQCTALCEATSASPLGFGVATTWAHQPDAADVLLRATSFAELVEFSAHALRTCSCPPSQDYPHGLRTHPTSPAAQSTLRFHTPRAQWSSPPSAHHVVLLVSPFIALLLLKQIGRAGALAAISPTRRVCLSATRKHPVRLLTIVLTQVDSFNMWSITSTALKI
mmetsp:Transcript_8615/g.23482  ORF Transcript_8615/g.23482 Transcript_8615/m.23482 type:complete len:275 (-) Transcript_8615:810-1634(-)